MRALLPQIRETVARAFHYFDKDRTGYMTADVLTAALYQLGMEATADQAASVLQRYDR